MPKERKHPAPPDDAEQRADDAAANAAWDKIGPEILAERGYNPDGSRKKGGDTPKLTIKSK